LITNIFKNVQINFHNHSQSSVPFIPKTLVNLVIINYSNSQYKLALSGEKQTLDFSSLKSKKIL